MLFGAAAQTLQAIARDEEHLGAQVGFTEILHTWGQDLRFTTLQAESSTNFWEPDS